jgi:hypothetical protein
MWPIFKVLSQNLCVGTRENLENPRYIYPVSGARLKPGRHEYEAGVLIIRPQLSVPSRFDHRYQQHSAGVYKVLYAKYKMST